MDSKVAGMIDSHRFLVLAGGWQHSQQYFYGGKFHFEIWNIRLSRHSTQIPDFTDLTDNTVSIDAHEFSQSTMDNIEEKLQFCESLIAYTFNDKLLLCQALQTSGTYINWRGNYTRVPKNTRLAVYGDIALNMALCRLWYPTELNKGTITLSLFLMLCLLV
jgi:hypothetical protein